MEMYSSEWISDRTGTETLAERQKLFTFFCETYMAPCSKIATQKNLQEQVRAHTGDLRRMILKAIQVHVHQIIVPQEWRFGAFLSYRNSGIAIKTINFFWHSL